MVTRISSGPLSSGNLKLKWDLVKDKIGNSDRPITEAKLQEILDELVDAVGQVMNNLERRK